MEEKDKRGNSKDKGVRKAGKVGDGEEEAGQVQVELLDQGGDRGESIQPKTRKRKAQEDREDFQPGRRSKEDGNGTKSISEFFEDKRREKIATACKIEESRESMKSCLEYIERNEE